MQKSDTLARAKDLLNNQFHIDGELFDFQEECIKRIIDEKKNVFCIRETGSGKSLCYQIPALMLEKDHCTVVISPLIALIDDQVRSLRENGIDAEAFHSQSHSKAERKRIEEEILRGDRKPGLIYTTPETLRAKADSFFSKLKISLLVIDEAHCVSVWGNDFRPSYRCIQNFIEKKLRTATPPIIAAFTATVDEKIFKDVATKLNMGIEKSDCIGQRPKKEFKIDNKSGKYKISLSNGSLQRNNNVCKFIIKHRNEKLLVFFSSKKLMEKVSKRLESMSSGLKFAKYFGGTNTDEAARAKENAFRLFSEGEVNILLATSAFGMGVDIGDIRHIIHVGFPLTMLDYIQQCGRGGRDGMGCEYKLYASLSDIKRCGRLISSKQLKMYPMSRCIKIQQKGRIKFAEVVDFCLNNAYDADPELIELFRNKLEMYMNSPVFEEYCLNKKIYQPLINTSPEFEKASYYENILADGIYSLWYNGATSFTARKLITCVTGNDKISLHNEKAGHIEEIIDKLIVKHYIPAEKRHTENGRTKYCFTPKANECMPDTFALQETALQNGHMCNIPNGVLKAMSDFSDNSRRKKRLDEDADVTVVKYYLLKEFNRIFDYSKKHGAEITDPDYEKEKYFYYCERPESSNKILYNHYDIKAVGDKCTGMYKATGFSFSIGQMHKIVCLILDNLIRHDYLCDYKVLYHSEKEVRQLQKRGCDLGAETPNGYIRGIELMWRRN